MNASRVIRYLDDQTLAIDALIDELDEIQISFNAQFDRFKTQHDAALDSLTDQIVDNLDSIGPQLRRSIEEQQPEERKRIEERCRKVREDHLPKRQKAADALLVKGQAELAQLRALNPQLDGREESLKADKAELEAELAKLNEDIRIKSRRLGVVRHFVSISRADRDRQRLIGRLEATNKALQRTRIEWEQQRQAVEDSQIVLQQQWQLESVATARLRSELDQLEDEAHAETLALRRAILHALDVLDRPPTGSSPDLESKLQEMAELNHQTDSYHEGLASVGGLIGLLRGISSGMKAIRKSIVGLEREQQMHSAYLDPLTFSVPPRVEAFHQRWTGLNEQFANEAAISAHPAAFAASVKPLTEGSLSPESIEAMFTDLGIMIERATAGW